MLQERLLSSCSEIGSPPERRRQVRQLALLRVALLHSGGVSDICVVRNVSPNGLSARVYRKLSPREDVEIEFRSGKLLTGAVVWEDEYDVGIVFSRPIDVAQVLASRWSAQPEKRRALPRITVDCAGRLSNGLRSVEVMLRDISQGGASLEGRAHAGSLGKVELSLPDLPPIAGVVRWISGPNLGVSFNECLAFETLARWIQARREGLGRLADGTVTAA
jgi:hypothetical protein